MAHTHPGYTCHSRHLPVARRIFHRASSMPGLVQNAGLWLIISLNKITYIITTWCHDRNAFLHCSEPAMTQPRHVPKPREATEPRSSGVPGVTSGIPATSPASVQLLRHRHRHRHLTPYFIAAHKSTSISKLRILP